MDNIELFPLLYKSSSFSSPYFRSTLFRHSSTLKSFLSYVHVPTDNTLQIYLVFGCQCRYFTCQFLQFLVYHFQKVPLIYNFLFCTFNSFPHSCIYHFQIITVHVLEESVNFFFDGTLLDEVSLFHASYFDNTLLDRLFNRILDVVNWDK